MPGITRRRILLGALGVATLSVAGRVTHQQLQAGPEGHSPYFRALSAALHDANVARASMVIDRERASANLERMLSQIRPDYHYRIVAKSLPSLDLLAWVMDRGRTDRLMLFNEPFLRQVSERFPASDILMGKPLPVTAAEHFYRERNAASGFDPQHQLQWLIDTPERLAQYAELAEQRETPMRISIEIDVGLHRGGVTDTGVLGTMVTRIRDNPWLTFSGLMGYEAHIVKAPGSTQGHFDDAMTRYREFLEVAESASGVLRDQLILNTGGSTTYNLYPGTDVVPNEIAAGSAIVQPADFDIPTLSAHQPAAFIASPVLKASDGLHLPGAPGVGKLLALWDRRYEQTFFIDRGNWKAVPASPDTLRFNPLYGRSSNQDMLNGPEDLGLSPGDFLFFRPTQSEAVLRQFGPLLVHDATGNRIVQRWAPFRIED